MAFEEYPKCFAFGGKVITDDLKKMEEDFSSKEDLLVQLATVSVVFTLRKPKNGKHDYMGVEFVEN